MEDILPKQTAAKIEINTVKSQSYLVLQSEVMKMGDTIGGRIPGC
jgi:hypothetical protein